MTSEMKNKLTNWEAEPPKDAWDKINASLEKDDEYLLSQKLFQWQQQPAAHIWNNIEQQLSAPARVVPINSRNRNLIRYSTAAAAVILVAILAAVLVTNQTSSDSIAQGTPNSSVEEKQNTATQSNPIAPADSQTSYPLATNKPADNETPSNISSPVAKRKQQGHTAAAGQPVTESSYLDRYIVHTNQSGASVKLSKKLYDLYRCSELWSQEECTRQIKLWQEKAATSSMYASADFAGMLELLKSMQENQ